LSAPHWQRDLIIWPEAAITLFAHQADDFLDEMAARARAGGSTLVAGIPAFELDPVSREGVFRNTAIAIGKGEGRYVKRRLVPFGEYVPLENLLRGVIEFFDLPMSHARPGERQQPLLKADGWQLAMAICYEVIYPELVRVLAGDADLIVTISNDAWFGDSIGPLQHMQMARMRALENGRYVLRSTNNGVTAIVAADGRIRAQIPQFEPGVLVGDFEVMVGTTPYGRFGHLPVLAVALVLLFLPAFMGRPAKDAANDA
jgi:apolipoprotein N-acyltransferase